jgi:hypothetical protein
MSSEWEPDAAGEKTERLMEEKGLPEEDRDEVRRLAEYLRRRADRKALDAAGGGPLPPMPEGMGEWLLGEDRP